jgi:hypothetical protein
LLEEGHVVDRLFNAQNQAEFVVQLDRYRSHLMLDTAAQPTFVKPVTQFTWVIAVSSCQG